MWKVLRIAHMLGEGGEKKRIPKIHKPRQLRFLARSKDAGLRFAVARSRYATQEVLEILCKDESWPVRMAVACSVNIRPSMLEILLCDPEPPVREAARRHPLVVGMYRKHLDQGVHGPSDPRVLVASSDNSSDDALGSIIRCDSWMARAIAAGHVQNPQHMLLLAHDEDSYVRAPLAANIHLSEYIFGLLATDTSETVRGATAGNPKLPRRHWENLMKDLRGYVREQAKHNPSYRKE